MTENENLTEEVKSTTVETAEENNNVVSFPTKNDQKDETGQPFSMSSITEMVNSIDNMGRSLEMQRQLFDARERLSELCFAMEIKKDDQDLLHNKFMEKTYGENEILGVVKDLETINSAFFTREDGSLISGKWKTDSSSEFEMKKDLIVYLNEFYAMEKDITKSIEEINADIKTFEKDEVAGASATVANYLKSGIEQRIKEAEELEDVAEKERRLKMLSRMQSAYTFQEMMDLLDKYPSVIVSTISDIKNPQRVSDIGDRYRGKLRQRNTVSTLFGIISDDISKTIESQYILPDHYKEGYENLFAFFLIRFFSMKDWSDPKKYTKECHNSCVIVLMNLMSGNLDKDFRDEVVQNITKVWDKFLVELNK